MNFLSKKSIFGLIVFLLLAGTLIYLSNNREIQASTSNADMSSNPTAMLVSNIADETSDVLNTPFDFKVVMSKCTNKTTKPLVTLEVVILGISEHEKGIGLKPELYSYQWVADGAVLPERSPVLACFCARKVDVTVTRLKDGARVRKSVRLYVCNTKVPEVYEETK